MKKFRIKIDPLALADIQDITDQYNKQQEKLGNRFQETTIKQINKLAKDPNPLPFDTKKYDACR